MSHLFNSVHYVQFTLNNHAVLKKALESRLEATTETVKDEVHNLEGQEEAIMDGTNLLVFYEGEQIALPVALLELDNLGTILNEDVIKQNFNEEEVEELVKLLPGSDKSMINCPFRQRGLNGLTAVQNFERQLKKGHFTISREKQDEINEQLNKNKLKRIYIELYNTIRENQTQESRKVEKFTYNEEDSELESIEDLQERMDASDNSEATQTEEENNGELFEEYPNQILYRYDYTKLKVQEELLAIGQDRGERKMMALKNIITVKPRNSEWVENFRKQEYLRYLNPTKPWVYICEDGRRVTVAPVAKKLSVLTGKPRYHAMLKNERPACVTILTLARDAAARLPNGVGTRADICELVKQSQYITEDLPEEKLSSTISGALDRLHYMPDACVKYDSEKKLWIYLHVDRSHEHPGWGDDGDEYTEKNSVKKKKIVY